MTAGCGQRTFQTRIVVQLENTDILELIPEIRHLAAQLGLIGHKVGQGLAAYQFLRDGTANGSLSDVDAPQFLQLSDGSRQAATQFLVAVQVKFQQVGQLAQFLGQFAGEVVGIETDLLQLRHIVEEIRDAALELAAYNLQSLHFGEISQLGRNLPFHSADRAVGDAHLNHAALIVQFDAGPVGHRLLQFPLPGCLPVGTVGDVVDHHQRQGVALAVIQGFRFQHDGRHVHDPVHGHLHGLLEGEGLQDVRPAAKVEFRALGKASFRNEEKEIHRGILFRRRIVVRHAGYGRQALVHSDDALVIQLEHTGQRGVPFGLEFHVRGGLGHILHGESHDAHGRLELEEAVDILGTDEGNRGQGMLQVRLDVLRQGPALGRRDIHKVIGNIVLRHAGEGVGGKVGHGKAVRDLAGEGGDGLGVLRGETHLPDILPVGDQHADLVAGRPGELPFLRVSGLGLGLQAGLQGHGMRGDAFLHPEINLSLASQQSQRRYGKISNLFHIFHRLRG